MNIQRSKPYSMKYFYDETISLQNKIYNKYFNYEAISLYTLK